MATGTELFSLMTECRKYFGQISALICDIDASLADSHFPATDRYERAAIFGVGAKPNVPERWGPRFLIRVYARPEWGDKQNHEFWGFFVIYLRPEAFGQPMAVWGTAEPTNRNGNRGPIIKELHLHRPDPRLVELEHEKWVHPRFASLLWNNVSYRACPLVELSSTNVEKLVVPLCDKLNELNGRQPQQARRRPPATRQRASQ